MTWLVTSPKNWWLEWTARLSIKQYCFSWWVWLIVRLGCNANIFRKKTMAELCTLSQSVNTSGSIDLTVLILIRSSYGVNSSLYRGSVSYCFTSWLFWWLWKLKATFNQFLIWFFHLYKFHSHWNAMRLCWLMLYSSKETDYFEVSIAINVYAVICHR